MRRRIVVAISLAICLLAAVPPAPRLSKKERAERLRLLPEEECRWLEDLVAPIILPDEELLPEACAAARARDLQGGVLERPRA